MTRHEVGSACIGVCEVTADTCKGCGRQMEEIAAWPAADDGARLSILMQAAQRLARQAPRPWPRQVRDPLGNELVVPAPPQRIVSLVPSQTELLYALGVGERVVGVTKFCVHPAQARGNRRSVGGTKNPKLDRVQALKPDLVLANREENRAEDIDAIAAHAPVYVTEVNTVNQALGMIRAVGFTLGAEVAAARLAADIQSALGDLPRLSDLRCAYLIWRKPWMAAGGDTFINDLMQRLGLHNVFASRPRYPQIDAAELIAAAPDVLLLSSEPYPFKPAHAAELTALLPKTLMVPVDGEMFSWPGSRLLAAARYFRQLLPRLADPAGAVT